MDIEQLTDEWFEARLGKATASHFEDIVGVGKNGAPLAGRKNYKMQLVLERVTGLTPDRFQTGAMGWGTDTEDLAAMAYALETGNGVTKAGFIEHPELAAGASPDRLVGEDGGLEIKCLNSANHFEVLKAQAVPIKHMAQIQGNLWITGRKWWDFASFDPDMPEKAQLFIKRVLRDEEYIANLEAAVRQFLAEVAADVEFLNSYE